MPTTSEALFSRIGNAIPKPRGKMIPKAAQRIKFSKDRGYNESIPATSGRSQVPNKEDNKDAEEEIDEGFDGVFEEGIEEGSEGEISDITCSSEGYGSNADKFISVPASE